MKADILIGGFIKCGQESLAKYYQQLDPSLIVYRDEFITRPDAVEYYENFGWDNYPNIVVIVRDPVDRCWSAYHYFQRWNHPCAVGKTYEQFLTHKSYHSGWGETNPIYMSNYERFIQPFRDAGHNIDVIQLQDLIGPSFPHNNINAHNPMSDADRKLTEKLLDLDKKFPMIPSENPNCDKCGNGKNTEFCKCPV